MFSVYFLNMTDIQKIKVVFALKGHLKNGLIFLTQNWLYKASEKGLAEGKEFG